MVIKKYGKPLPFLKNLESLIKSSKNENINVKNDNKEIKLNTLKALENIESNINLNIKKKPLPKIPELNFRQATYSLKPFQTNSQIDIIRGLLKNDSIDSLEYKELDFTCHQFAKVMFLKYSENTHEVNIEDIKSNWKVDFKESSKKLPLFIINLYDSSTGYAHAINAVLLDHSKPGDPNSYIYFEPQTDQLFSISNLCGHLDYIGVNNFEMIISSFKEYDSKTNSGIDLNHHHFNFNKITKKFTSKKPISLNY